MVFSGDLNTFSLADVFQTMAQNQQTGTLRVFDEDTQKYIFFSQGAIRSVSRGKRRSIPIGELLVAKGKISEEQLAAALAVHANNEHRLGSTLAEQGSCNQEDIDEVFRFQMEEEIFDLFTWKNARFEFAEGTTETTVLGKRERVTEVRLNTSGLIMEAMRRIDEWNRITEVIPSMNMVFLADGTLAEGQMPEWTDGQQQRVISMVDGINTIEAIIRKSLLGQYVVTQTLAECIRQNLLRETTPDEMRTAGEQCLLAGDPVGAVGIYQRLLEVEGENTAVRANLANSQESTGLPEEAARSYRVLAKLRTDEGNFKGAIDAYERAGKLSTLSAQEMDRLAELYLVVNRTNEAANMWLTRARTLLDSRNVTGARAVCEKALEHFADSEEMLSLLARVCIDDNDSKAAVETYEKLAALYERRGNLTGAMSTYRHILHLDASRLDLRDKIKRMQERTQRKQHEGHLRLAVTGALAACILLVGLAIFLEWRARSGLSDLQKKTTTAVREAAETENLNQRVKILEETLTAWQKFKPAFSVMDLSDIIIAEKARLQELLTTASELKEERVSELHRVDEAKFDKALSLLNSQAEDDAQKARTLLQELATKKPSTEWTRKAEEKIASMSDRKDKARTIYERYSQAGRSRENRFADVMEIVTTFPRSEYLKQVTLPVVLSVSPPLPATVEYGGKSHRIDSLNPSVILELPPLAPFTVKILRRGFGKGGTTVWQGTDFREPSRTITLEREVIWQNTELLDGEVLAAPVFGPAVRTGGGPVCYLANSQGNVVAIDPRMKRAIWQFKGEERGFDFRTMPHLEDNKLYLLDYGGQLVCLDAQSGKLQWPQAGARNGYDGTLTSEPLFTRLRFFEDQLFCLAGSSDGRIVCLNTQDGGQRWLYDSTVRVPLKSRGAIHESFMYFPIGDDTIHILRGDGQRVEQLKMNASARAPLSLAGNKLIAATMEGRIRSWKTGLPASELWSTPKTYGPIRAPLLVKSNTLFAASEGGQATALDLTDGTTLWERGGLPGAVRGPLALDGSRLLVASGGELVALDPDNDGAILWQLQLSKDALTGISVKDGFIALGDENGGIFLLEQKVSRSHKIYITTPVSHTLTDR